MQLLAQLYTRHYFSDLEGSLVGFPQQRHVRSRALASIGWWAGILCALSAVEGTSLGQRQVEDTVLVMM